MEWRGPLHAHARIHMLSRSPTQQKQHTYTLTHTHMHTHESLSSSHRCHFGDLIHVFVMYHLRIVCDVHYMWAITSFIVVRQNTVSSLADAFISILQTVSHVLMFYQCLSTSSVFIVPFITSCISAHHPQTQTIHRQWQQGQTVVQQRMLTMTICWHTDLSWKLAKLSQCIPLHSITITCPHTANLYYSQSCRALKRLAILSTLVYIGLFICLLHCGILFISLSACLLG